MSQKRRVLVIDNDESICEFISMALVDMGYVVASAYNAQSALQLVPTFRPDLIILEMWLPIQSGQVFLDTYYQCSGLHAPVIALGTSTKYETMAREHGADTFIVKPFDLDELLSSVTSYLAT